MGTVRLLVTLRIELNCGCTVAQVIGEAQAGLEEASRMNASCRRPRVAMRSKPDRSQTLGPLL
jgi:hypothetical protein